MKPPFLSRSAIWTSADQFRQSHWPETAPPIDILKIVEFRCPLKLIPRSGLLSRHRVEAFLSTDLTSIVVDNGRYLDGRYTSRLRFSVAHELAHFVLHSGAILAYQFLNSGIQNWKRTVMDVTDEDHGWFEWQANEFAGRLLVPPASLVSAFNSPRIQALVGSARAMGYDDEAIRAYISSMIASDYFDVSGQVIERRLRFEQLI